MSSNGMAFTSSVASLCLAFLLSGARGQEPADKRIAEIEAAWKARQKKFDRAQMKWTGRVTLVKGSISDNAPSFKLRDNAKGARNPPEDVTYEKDCQFSLDGNKVRYGFSGKVWNASQGRLDAVEGLSTYDGAFSKEFYPKHEARTTPTGMILQKGSYEGASEGFLRPVILFFRPFEPELAGIDLSAFSVIGSSKVRGVQCIELQHSMGQSSLKLSLDPKRDYLLMRHTISAGGRPYQIDVDYRRDAQWGWVPFTWETSSTGSSGKIRESQSASVTGFDANRRLPSNDFDVAFTPGTRVTDDVERTRWLVLPGGGKRVLARGEPWPADEGEHSTASPAKRGASPWVIAWAVACGCACVLIFILRRVVRNRRAGVG